MTTLFFLFTWAFWKWFFIVMGIIFCLLLLVGAFMWWATEDFAADQPGFSALDRNQIGNRKTF